jgi:hypothetical protein
VSRGHGSGGSVAGDSTTLSKWEGDDGEFTTFHLYGAVLNSWDRLYTGVDASLTLSTRSLGHPVLSTRRGALGPALASRVSRSGYQLEVFAEGPERLGTGREPTMEETEEMEVRGWSRRFVRSSRWIRRESTRADYTRPSSQLQHAFRPRARRCRRP